VSYTIMIMMMMMVINNIKVKTQFIDTMAKWHN